MKKYLIIPIFLVICLVCGWANEVGMENDVICGEVVRNVTECQPCTYIRGCDGERYRIAVFVIPKCRFVKIINPVWGEVHVHCSEEGEGDAVFTREVRDYCITNYSSVECISSCEECTEQSVEPENPCANVSCSQKCIGHDLWSMRCVDGECVTDELIEPNSTACGYNPCENHCSNGKKDCGEYGIDCGGGCPFKDSDYDGVEDCKDACPNSPCNKVDVHGCETDLDSDGVTDCNDECPHEKGDSSHRGCPSNILFWVAGIGGAAAAAGATGTAISKGIKGKELFSRMRAVKDAARPLSEDIAMRKEAAEKIAEEVARETVQKTTEAATEKVGTKLAEAATKEVGTKLAEAATEKVGTKLAEAATKEVGTKLAEAATKEVGTKLAEAATEKVGDELAKTAIGAGVAGTVKKMQEKFVCCPKCGEKLPSDSKFCSKCGHNI